MSHFDINLNDFNKTDGNINKSSTNSQLIFIKSYYSLLEKVEWNSKEFESADSVLWKLMYQSKDGDYSP